MKFLTLKFNHMINQVSRKKSLIKLREFCSTPPQGMISNWWFYGLVNRFPLHFLYYSQFSKNLVGTKKRAKEKILFRFEYKVKQLLEYPISEKEIGVVEEIWDKLDELIKINKQIQSN
jgi:hypothetical protein